MKEKYRKSVETINKALARYELLDDILNGKNIKLIVEYSSPEDDFGCFSDGDGDGESDSGPKQVYLDVPTIHDEVISSLALLRSEAEQDLDRLVEFFKKENERDD